MRAFAAKAASSGWASVMAGFPRTGRAAAVMIPSRGGRIALRKTLNSNDIHGDWGESHVCCCGGERRAEHGAPARHRCVERRHGFRVVRLLPVRLARGGD